MPGLTDVLRADIGGLRRGFSGPEAQSSRIFGVLSALLDDKRGHYEMRIVYCPPLSLLWSFLPGDGSAASFVHKFYEREVWRERGVWARLRLLAAFLLWPFVTVGTIGWFTWLNGEAIRSRTGKSVSRQMAEQLHLAAVHSVLSPWYYMFDLFDDEKRIRAGEYLHRFETKGGIFRFLKRAPRGSARAPLQDKLGFALWCRSHQIPSASIVLAVDRGELRREFLPDRSGLAAQPELPDVDLFVKPQNGRGGFGAERWRCEAHGRYVDERGTILTAPELLASSRARFPTRRLHRAAALGEPSRHRRSEQRSAFDRAHPHGRERAR